MNARHEMVFVDTRLANYQTLLQEVPSDAEVYLLDASRDGLTQILESLSGRSGIDAIHVLGHGSSGEMQFGTTTLEANNLASYQTQLAQLGQSLSHDGDLLLYGCNVAEGDSGQAFIEQLAKLTGADLAASTNVTGAAAQGGDWQLESSTGLLETTSLQSMNYGYILPTSPVSKTYTQLGETGTTILDDAETFVAFPIISASIINLVNYSSPSGIQLVVRNTIGSTWDNANNLTSSTGGFSAGGGYDSNPAGGTAIEVNYAVKVDWDVLGAGTKTMTFTVNDNNNDNYDYTVDIIVTADGVNYVPPVTNHAPTAGSVQNNPAFTVAEGSSNQNITLTNSNTGSSDQDASDTLTYSPASASYTAVSNPSLKGTVNNVGTTSYTVSDGTASPVSGTIYWNVTYGDDAPTGTLTATGISREAQVLTATNNISDIDDGGAGVSKAYQWQYYNTATNQWINIASNSTTSTFTPTASELADSTPKCNPSCHAAFGKDSAKKTE